MSELPPPTGKKPARLGRRRKAKHRSTDGQQVELLPGAIEEEPGDVEPPAGGGEDSAREAARPSGPGALSPIYDADRVDDAPDHVDDAPGGLDGTPGHSGTTSPGAASGVSGQPARGDAGPRSAGHQLARARDLVHGGRIEEAIETYRAILVDNPVNLKALNNLGVLFDELGRHELASAHFNRALEVEPNSVEVLVNQAAALAALTRYDEAGELLRRALRLAPDDPGGRYASAVLCFRRGLYAQAEVELRWVCERDPAHGLAFYYRGESLNRLNRYEEAAELLEYAVELLPDDPRPAYTLGHLFDRRGMREEASDMYRRARDLQRAADGGS